MTRFTVQGGRRASDEERATRLTDPGFGARFSDHMAMADWTPQRGWHDHRIVADGPIALDPAAAVFHYAQEAFEGLKAYAHADGSIWRFRADVNAARFRRSCRRLALPELPEVDFLAGIDELVACDRDWVPTGAGASLYLRPFMFARSPMLAVKPSTSVTYAVIASPSGAYFGGSGVQCVDIWFTRDYTRAAPGGTGAAKCGGNYAASMVAQQEAEAHGCSQVGFLDAVEKRYVEELGGMNIFVLDRDGTLATPALTDSILEGVTRDSILRLAADRGLRVQQRRIALDALLEGIDSGRCTEVFACGTAAVITPIGTLRDAHGTHTVRDGSPGEVTLALRETLTGIQNGLQTDPYGWMHRIV